MKQLKTVFFDGILLVGKYEKKFENQYLIDPLVIIPVSEKSIKLSPFGAGFVSNKVQLPKDILLSDVTEYGKDQYESAWENIKKEVLKDIEKQMN